MVLEVEQFEDTEDQLAVEDIADDVKVGASINTKTASQLAATDTILVGDSVNSFRQTREELLDPAKRHQFLLRQQQIRDTLREDAMNAILPALADDTLSPEEKMDIAAGGAPDIPQIEVSTLDTLAEETLIADGEPEEPLRTAESRLSMSDKIHEAVRVKRELQQMVNDQNIGHDSSAADKIIDLGEILVPLAEWAHYESLLSDVDPDEASRLRAQGETKQALFNVIKAIPIKDRPEFARGIMQIVQENDNVILPDGNDLLTLEALNRMLIEDDYSDAERWFDNITGVLDVIGVGSIGRWMSRGAKAGKFSKTGTDVAKPGSFFKDGAEILDDGVELDPTMKTVSPDARAHATRTEVQPASPSEVVKQTNPAQARDMHRLVLSEGDEAAEALYGTSKSEAVANDLLPAPAQPSNKINNKPAMPDNPEPPRVREATTHSGQIDLSDAEIKVIHGKVAADLADVEGLTHRATMPVRYNDDGTYGYTVYYRPPDAGFRTPEEAIEKAAFALRDYGVTEDNLKLYVRQADAWVETSRADENAKAALRKAGATGKEVAESEYSIGLDLDYRISHEDMDTAELLNTGNLFSRPLDWIPTQFLAQAGQGSLVQNLMDPASVIPPRLLGAASVAVDKSVGIEAILRKEFEGFSKHYAKLEKDRRAAMAEYIKEANDKRFGLNMTDLKKRGFSDKEIALLKEWRRANDVLWHVDNRDMARRLKSQGYVEVVDKKGDSLLLGRPLSKSMISSNDDVYDMTGNILNLNKEEVAEIYEKGGEIVLLAAPIEINGVTMNKVISRNAPDLSYSRKLREESVVLPYIEGYYPVRNRGNWFVEKVQKIGGREVRTVVAASDTTQDGRRMVVNLTREEAKKGVSYTLRAAKERTRAHTDALDGDDGAWQLAQMSGLSSQKVRGKPLQYAGGNAGENIYRHLEDPLAAIATQIRSVSNSVALRPVLDRLKKRWMLNYGKHLQLPTNPKTGKMEFPTSVKGIKNSPMTSLRLASEARTMYNYIHSLENGYINGIDDAYRAVVNTVGERFGEIGMGKTETAILTAAQASPTAMAKTSAFKLLIAGAPLRQALLQRGQILQLGAVHPTYMPKLANDLMQVDLVRWGLSKDPKYVALFKEIKNAGLMEAVDANNLARGQVLALADISAAQKVKGAVSAPFDVMQKYGFDQAEQDVLVSAWLTFRDKALKEGKDINTPRGRENLLAETRAYTLSMNRAGSMAFSRNALAVPAQFLEFSHKALIQPVLNKNLSGRERVQLLAYTTALWGLPASAVSVLVDDWFDSTDPSGLKDAVKQGALSAVANAAWTNITGEDQAVNWTEFAPAEVYSFGNVFTAILQDQTLVEIIAESPSGSLLFGGNPRVADAFRTAVRAFVPFTDYDDPELQVDYIDVVTGVANMTSGYSQAWKAAYAIKSRQKLNGTGRVSDSDVTTFEALMGLFGVRTQDEAGMHRAYEIMFSGKGGFEQDDVAKWYNEIKRRHARRGISAAEQEMDARILSEAMMVFGEDYARWSDMLGKEMEKDAMAGDFRFIKGLIQASGFKTQEENMELLNALPAGKARDSFQHFLNINKESTNG